MNGVSFGNSILQDNPLEDLVALVFRVRALVHQVVVISVHIEQTHEVGVENRLQHVLAVDTAYILNFFPF